MKSPTVIKKTPPSRGSGSFGSYHVLDNQKRIGLKVMSMPRGREAIERQFVDHTENLADGYEITFFDGWNSKRGSVMERAAHEISAMEMVGGRRIPKPYGLAWVKKGNRWSVGILMSHIRGTHTYSFARFSREMNKKAYKNGIYIDDWHGGNVLKSANGTLYRIDFGAGFFEVRRSFRYEFKQRVHHWIQYLMSTFPEKKKRKA